MRFRILPGLTRFRRSHLRVRIAFKSLSAFKPWLVCSLQATALSVRRYYFYCWGHWATWFAHKFMHLTFWIDMLYSLAYLTLEDPRPTVRRLAYSVLARFGNLAVKTVHWWLSNHSNHWWLLYSLAYLRFEDPPSVLESRLRVCLRLNLDLFVASKLQLSPSDFRRLIGVRYPAVNRFSQRLPHWRKYGVCWRNSGIPKGLIRCHHRHQL
jgi:hypothetical protein